MPFDSANFPTNPRISAAVGVLDNCIEALHKRGSWCKGVLENGKARCLVGWIYHYAGQQFGDRICFELNWYLSEPPAHWNDCSRRTKRQVISKLEAFKQHLLTTTDDWNLIRVAPE